MRLPAPAFCAILLASAAHPQAIEAVGDPALRRPEIAALSITIPNGNALRIQPFGHVEPLAADSAELSLPMDTSASGGHGVVSTIRAYTTIRGAPDADLWPILGVVDYVGSGGTGQHVPVYGQGIRRATPAPGGAANNPQIWGGVFQSMDMTGTASSRANAQLSVENDLNVGNVDDANARQGLVQVLGTYRPTGPDGQPLPAVPAEASRAIGITTDEYGQWKRQIHPTGNYQTASIDLRDARDNGANSGARPIVTQALQVPSDTITVSNVMPFTSDQFSRDINRGFRAPITIGGRTYVQSAYAISGTGPGGTVTLTGPVALRDAYAGAPVRNASHTLWLGTGQDIAFDTLGTVRLTSDGLGLAIRVAGAGAPVGAAPAAPAQTAPPPAVATPVLPATTVASPGGPLPAVRPPPVTAPALRVLAGQGNAAIALLDAGDGQGWSMAGAGRDFVVAQMPAADQGERAAVPRLAIDGVTGATRLASFTVRDLPRVGPGQQGQIAYAIDCRNPGEVENDGSGCLVTVNRGCLGRSLVGPPSGALNIGHAPNLRRPSHRLTHGQHPGQLPN